MHPGQEVTPRRAPRRPAAASAGRWWLALALLAGGCGAPVYENPMGVMADREAPAVLRLDAARQAEARFPDDPQFLAVLEAWVYEPRGVPFDLRRYAIDHLLRRDEAAFRRSLARRINAVENWDTLVYVCQLAGERRWVEFAPALVRSWARPAKGAAEGDRPEARAIRELHPDREPREVVFEVFANAQGQASAAEQAAAWELLARLADVPQLTEMLSRAPDRTPMVVDLKAAAAELRALPRNREGLLWLAHLRDPARGAFWAAARARVAQLTPQQQAGLELRHLPALVRADADLLATDRPTLLRALAQELAGREHHTRSPIYDGQDRDYPQSLLQWQDQLCWADLAVLRHLLHAMRDPALQRELFAQAGADHDDPTTEYGGVLDWTGAAAGGAFGATLFKPLARSHDRKYVPHQDLFNQLYTALAHYHFHAMEWRNQDNAGPGRGDLNMASVTGANCLVLTFIDGERLNVDYFQPNGATVDLGTLRR